MYMNTFLGKWWNTTLNSPYEKLIGNRIPNRKLTPSMFHVSRPARVMPIKARLALTTAQRKPRIKGRADNHKKCTDRPSWMPVLNSHKTNKLVLQPKIKCCTFLSERNWFRFKCLIKANTNTALSSQANVCKLVSSKGIPTSI